MTKNNNVLVVTSDFNSPSKEKTADFNSFNPEVKQIAILESHLNLNELAKCLILTAVIELHVKLARPS